MTREDVHNLIKQIAEATRDKEWGKEISNLMSAMRGPDTPITFDYPAVKEKTTMIIRTILGWECGLLHESNVFTAKDIDINTANIGGYHFTTHIRSARNALEKLGF